MTSGSVWVESPLQLLSAVEAFSAGLLGDRATALVRADGTGMAEFIRAVEDRRPPDGFTVKQAGPVSELFDSGHDIVAIGDAFSGRVQRELVRRTVGQRIVLLDDGTSTISLLDKISRNSPIPLTRDRNAYGMPRKLLGLLARRQLRGTAKTGRLVSWTAMPIPPHVRRRFTNLGGKLEPHEFSWLRHQPDTDMVAEPTVIIGSALAPDGLIAPENYFEWLSEVAAGGPARYFPHRRESSQQLDRIARLPQMVMDVAGLPIEWRLRGLNHGQRIVCLPTTALISLSMLLGDHKAEISPKAVPEEWWTSAAPAVFRQNLNALVRNLD